MLAACKHGVRCAMMLGLIALAGCALFEKSNREIVRVKAQYDRQKAEALNDIGVHQLSKSEIREATHSFESALLHDETYAAAHNNLGRILFDAGDMFQAAVSFETASRLDPNEPAAYNNLGLVMEYAGRMPEAIEQYELAHEICPVCPEYLANLVRVRVRLGETDESVQEQLRMLLLIETRPEWREWADRQLSLDMNPYLDRGPPAPDLSALQGDRDQSKTADRDDFTIPLDDSLLDDSSARDGFSNPSNAPDDSDTPMNDTDGIVPTPAFPYEQYPTPPTLPGVPSTSTRKVDSSAFVRITSDSSEVVQPVSTNAGWVSPERRIEQATFAEPIRR